MTRHRVYECIKQLKTKDCEGYDRIPQRILLDGIDAYVVDECVTLYINDDS